MSRPAKPDATNLTIKLTARTRDRLNDLQKRSEAASLSEVIRRSAEIYEVLLESKCRREELILRDSNGNERRVVLT